MDRIVFPQRKEKETKRKENKQLINNLTKQQIKQLSSLPVRVEDRWWCAVAGHIKELGFDRVADIAARAAQARQPERYLMKALSSERYGY